MKKYKYLSHIEMSTFSSKNLTISALKSLAIAQAMTTFFALICPNFLTWSKRTYLNPKGILLLLTNVILISFSNAQSDLNQKIQDAAPQNFFEKQKVINDYYEVNPTATGYKQWKRKEWFLEPRLYPTGESMNITSRNIKAYQKLQKLQTNNRSTHGGWFFLGPNDWVAGFGGKGGQGRVNCIEIHPNNENIIYIGASNGGIWKTTDGGSNWTNVTPNLPILSIADIEIDPNNPNRVFAITGDGDPVPGESGSHSQTQVTSIGVIRSTNSGGTWYATNFSFDHPSGLAPYKLLMHPTDADIQFIASDDGIYKTTDGWATNSLVHSGETFDIEYRPGVTSTMYASGSNWIRRSTNSGNDWTQVTDSDFSSLSGSSRIELAVSPDNNFYVYALAGDWDEMRAFLRSSLGGVSDSWTLMDDTTSVMGKFATYCIGLDVDPTDYTDVYGGMQWISRSLSSGNDGTWSRVTNGVVHADIHDVVKTANNLYVASDGGIFKSDDEGDSWTDISPGLAITEIYRIAGTPQEFGTYYMGTQDNGTYQREVNSTFERVLNSDGTTCAIDYTDSDIVYGGKQNGSFHKSTNGGDSFSALNVAGSGGNWISPMTIDPVDPDVLFFGKTNCYRSDDAGSTFENLGSPWSGDLNCIAQGESVRNRLYASASSNIYRTDNALVAIGPATWTNIGTGLPNSFITGIVVDPDNSMRVFVTLSGYVAGEKVFRSVNGGSTWVNISGSLPNVPANCIAFDNSGVSDALYVGTDIGVFYRDNVLGDWIYFSNRLPSVNISDLYVNEPFNVVVAGTYGRGLWMSATYSGCPDDINLNTLVSSEYGGTLHYSANNTITTRANYAAELSSNVQYTAGEFIEMLPGFHLRRRGRMIAAIGGCPGINTILAALQGESPLSSSNFIFDTKTLERLGN